MKEKEQWEVINTHLTLKRNSDLTNEKVFAFLKRCITTLLNPFWAARESFLTSQLFWDSTDEQKTRILVYCTSTSCTYSVSLRKDPP